MSFKINDLVINITREAQGCPPKSCFNTDMTGFVALEEFLGKDNPMAVEIQKKLDAELISDPTKEDLQMLVEKLEDALAQVKAKM